MTEPAAATPSTSALTLSAARLAARLGQTFRIPTLSAYLMREIAIPTLLFLVSCTALAFLILSIDKLELVVNRAQSALTFLYLTLLAVPSLLPVILPISLFGGVLFTLNRLVAESELPVIWAAGIDRFSLARPVIALALIATLLAYGLNLWLMPASYRAFKDRIQEVRGAFATSLLKEGQFTTPVKGLTIFIGSAPPGGDLKNIFAHDNRKPLAPVTYMARRGVLFETPEGPRIRMYDGNLQWLDEDAAAPRVLRFDQYTFDLGEFAPAAGEQRRELTERYLSELFAPRADDGWAMRNRPLLLAEGHARLATPLYNIAFALIAYVAIACGPFTRRRQVWRLIGATGQAILLWLLGFGAKSLSATVPAVTALQYMLPLGAIGAAILMMLGLVPDLRAIARRLGHLWTQERGA